MAEHGGTDNAQHEDNPENPESGTSDARSDRTTLGIEFGSTRIKACLLDADGTTLATGTHEWENTLVDDRWTYSLEAIHTGLQSCCSSLLENARQRLGARPSSVGAIGISAMMHGYLALDEDDHPLVPFRTWRTTTTGQAAAELTEVLGQNIPQRWSAAHLYQAILDEEDHVARVRTLTTLAGYVHWCLTGRHVLGVGDASGMFPLDTTTHDYDEELLERFDRLTDEHGFTSPLRSLLPRPLLAGEDAGTLTPQGALLLDPTGTLRPGIPLCPPEGDAGTGMVATGAVCPRSGTISAGTSIFAMVVLEHPLATVHPELDLVTTPAGDPVAMVHCNNGASELGEWAQVFGQFANALGHDSDPDTVFDVLLNAALDAEPDAGGLLAYDFVAGEPILDLDAGRPLLARAPNGRLTLANLVRSLVLGSFATLAIGMRILSEEGTAIDTMHAHGGIFKTPGVAQRLLAAAIGSPVAVSETAAEGGAWGIALLARYRLAAIEGEAPSLGDFARTHVLGGKPTDALPPDPRDEAGFATYLERFRTGLPLERAASSAI